MSRVSRLLLVLSTVLLLAAKQRAVRVTNPPGPRSDIFSFSEPAKVVVDHVAFDVTIDPATRRISGNETLDIQNLSGTDKLVLDTYGIDVHSVTRDGHVPTTFAIGTGTTINGAPLSIDITPTTRSVTIDYTATQTNGVRWTFNGPNNRTFVYTDAEPTGTRTWLPMQDTPAVRVTYDATLRVPPNLLALMTAENNATASNATGIYTFHQGSTLPSYLIAFAVGDLAYHPFDARTGVYADPAFIDSYTSKLDYIPSLLTSAESLLGPYPWTRYDIVIMPSPYSGGMENPNINFISPNVIYQGQPARLISHEMSHSWFGDMVTLADWPDTWLNEGAASYYEVRLIEPSIGKEAADQIWRSRINPRAPYFALHLPLPATVDPGEVFGPQFAPTEYTKGALFLHTIETIVGRDAFDAFMRDYLARFAWRWVDDVAFKSFLASRFDITPIRVDQWLYQAGLPDNVAGFFQSFQVAAPQTIENSSAADDVRMVAVTGPSASDPNPAKRLETLIVNVTNP